METAIEDEQSAKEARWIVQQINWQRTRYVYDMHFKFHRISKECWDYCTVKNKIVDADLARLWKKRGYEKCCSTFAVNPANFNYGTVCVCRVPITDMDKEVKSDWCGCRGCGSGDAGYDNIFGNKYGQKLAKVQVIREKVQAEARRQIEEELREEEEKALAEALDEEDKAKIAKKKRKAEKKALKEAEKKMKLDAKQVWEDE